MNKLGFLKLITLKRAFITLGCLFGLAVLGVGGFALYIIIPSGLQSSFAKGPEMLTELKQMADQSQPFNPDPYVASTYRPGNPLYKPVLNIQRKRWDLAEKQLQPLVKLNNADAMFWLAHITYRTGFYASGPAAELYQRSAELGNPYAALALDADNIECQRYMGYYCDKKWGKLGHKLLKQRADNGDLKAAFHLVRIDINERSSSAEVWRQLVQLATKNAKQHNYYPLFWLLENYTGKIYYPILDKDNPLPLEQNKNIVQLAMLAANNNHTPTMAYYAFGLKNLLLDNYTNKYISHLVDKILRLNIFNNVYQNYYAVNTQPRKNVIKGSAYAIAEDIIKDKRNHHNLNVYKYIMNKNNLQPLTEPEINQAKEMAPKLINQMTPVIYIDEMNPRP